MFCFHCFTSAVDITPEMSLKFSLLIDGDAIYQTEAFEQPTIPDSETLPFSIYQIELVGQLMNQINRRLRQTN